MGFEISQNQGTHSERFEFHPNANVPSHFEFKGSALAFPNHEVSISIQKRKMTDGSTASTSHRLEMSLTPKPDAPDGAENLFVEFSTHKNQVGIGDRKKNTKNTGHYYVGHERHAQVTFFLQHFIERFDLSEKATPKQKARWAVAIDKLTHGLHNQRVDNPEQQRAPLSADERKRLPPNR